MLYPKESIKEHDVQAGFRKGRGTRDQIANILWIMEKAREFQKSIYFCFIDYTKAFDCVDHNKLWKILKEMAIPGHVNRLRLLQDKPDPLSLLISHKLSTPTGLWSLLLSLYQKYFKRYHSTGIAIGILQILKEMGIPDHLICLLRNLYAGQEAIVRTGHGTTDWFQIGKGVHQGYILSPCLFNL